MDVQELKFDFDIDLLAKEIAMLMEKYPLHEHHHQLSLKHTSRIEPRNLWYEGTGSLKYSFNGQSIPKEQEKKLSQDEFTVLNKELNGTYIEEVHNILAKKYNFGRFRVMGMKPKKCMSIHVDSAKRIHIPVLTHEYCKMMIDNVVYHLPANGNAYLTNTTKPHTAFNGTHDFYRIHLLADLI